jgi:hypothetical protein
MTVVMPRHGRATTRHIEYSRSMTVVMPRHGRATYKFRV